jgi:ribosomal protein S18 acetylase RimI-like enzyme
MSVSISQANTTHAEVLANLSIATFCETFAHNNSKADMDKYIADNMQEAHLLAELQDNRNIFYLAWHHNRLAGYAKVRTGQTPPEMAGTPNAVELERIYVLKEFIGKKVGAALLQQCLGYAVQHHYSTLWLGVWEHNQPAIAFYQRWGFTFCGSHAFLLGNDLQTDLLMKKDLPAG